MSKRCCILLLAFLPNISTVSQGADPTPSRAALGTEATAVDGLHLVWQDEFNDDGELNSANWRFEKGFVRNEEAQWYQAANARCTNGMLVIEGRRERITNPRYQRGSDNWKRNREFAEYTSASLNTRGKHEWLYGRFEMRGRIDVRSGLWPAFWTLGSAQSWPACGEVDIMEYYDGKLLANAAWLGPRGRPQWDRSLRPIRQFSDAEWARKLHVWRMDWDRNAIRLSVDGELLNTVDLGMTINSDDQRSNPFHQPHYILLNLAVGGTQGGDPSVTEFPASFEIDYVRVYQAP